jgi:endonuclease YncB( thermonuclease family)
MPNTYPTPHLYGWVSYQGKTPFSPDGDTIHLHDPVLIDAGGVHRPSNGELWVHMPGKRPIRLALKPKSSPSYLTIRLSGIDAPEEHYRGTTFELEGKKFSLKPGSSERSQPMWKPSTDFLLGRLEKAHWALLELDRDVVDSHDRVLAYVFESDKSRAKGAFLTLELLKRGLVFPFVFESAEDYVATFLQAAAAARRKGLGVWKNYQDAPLPYAETFPRGPDFHTAPPPAQDAAPLNLPVVFRRVVDVEQLAGLTLPVALRKYDCIDHATGNLVPGDRFQEIPIDNRIWAPHEYTAAARRSRTVVGVGPTSTRQKRKSAA